MIFSRMAAASAFDGCEAPMSNDAYDAVASIGRSSRLSERPSKELSVRIREGMSQLSAEARHVLGAIQLVREDSSGCESLLQMHFERLGLSSQKHPNHLESLSNDLAEMTPRDLANILERLRVECRIRKVVFQLPLQARLGIIIAIQAYLDTLVSISAAQVDEDALCGILQDWCLILDVENDLEPLAHDVAALAPQDGAEIVESLRMEPTASHVVKDELAN